VLLVHGDLIQLQVIDEKGQDLGALLVREVSNESVRPLLPVLWVLITEGASETT